MIEPIPKWILRRYAQLWDKFRNTPFTHEQATKYLKDEKQVVSVFLSDLKKAGWLTVTVNQKDTRQRMYVLKAPNEAIKEMVK